MRLSYIRGYYGTNRNNLYCSYCFSTPLQIVFLTFANPIAFFYLSAMQNFTDVFISYGRKQSKFFATQLYNQLLANGYTAWFDQNDIPLGVDYQNQIDDGIEKAHNFLFIISPHSVVSPYCRLEVELAYKHRKRIIPILHVEGFEFEKLHPIIGKINWIYLRETLPQDSIDWHQAQPADDFEKGFAGLLNLLTTQQDYVAQHTALLYHALAWERNQQTTHNLLVGNDRLAAEQWLLTEFKPPAQPPCEPSDLHAEFICESKKNANNLMTDVFICAADKENVIATTTEDSYGNINEEDLKQAIKKMLEKSCITTWVHHKDIQKGEDTEKAILQGIEQADNFLFFISNASLASQRCLKELEYAALWKKRIIPLLIEKVEEEKFPKEIKGLHYINFIDNIERKLIRQEMSDFQKDINELLHEIQTDETYHNQHKVFLTQALKWQRNHKNNAFLLRGYNLQNAQTFLASGKNRTQHQPTRLHKILISESAAKIGQLSSEVFISYSRTDGDFARQLNNELQSIGKTTWFDQESIATGANFQKEIYKGIENSDNFLFIISDKALASPFCRDEVEYAVSLNKRFVTVLIPEGLHNPELLAAYPDLAKIQWIDFCKKDFEKAFFELINTLNTDREYIHNHTKYSQRATDWQDRQRSPDLLLQGEFLLLAKTWIEEAEKLRKKPLPPENVKDYIVASERAWQSRLQKEEEQRNREALLEQEKIEALQKTIALQQRSARRQRWFLLAALLLTGVAVAGYVQAYFSQKQMEKQSIELAKQSNYAHEQAVLAAQEQKEAKINADRAELERKKAQHAFYELQTQSQATEKQRHLALHNLEKAKENEEAAKRNLLLAEKAQQEALKNLEIAKVSETKANEALEKRNKLINFFGFGAENRAWAYRDGKFAIIDKDGNKFTDFVFGEPTPFQNGVAQAELDNDFAIVNANGDTLTAGYEFFVHTNNDLIYTKKNNQYGFINADGKLVNNSIWFDNVWQPSIDNQVGWIRKNGLWGLMSTSGNLLINPQFDEKTDFSNQLARVRKEQKWGLLNNEGVIVVPPTYDSVAILQNSYSRLQRNAKVGLADPKGNLTLPLIYNEIIELDANLLMVADSNNRWALFPKTGLPLTPKPYLVLEKSGKKGILQAKNEQGWGLIDLKGRELITPQFDNIETFDAHDWAVVSKQGNYGVLNGKGDWIIPADYQAITILPNLVLAAKKENRWGLLDSKGKVLLPLTYDKIEPTETAEIVRLVQANKIGLFNVQSKTLLPADYDEILPFKPNLAFVRKEGKWGVINKLLKVLAGTNFDQIYDFSGGLARCKRNNKFSYLDGNGKLILPLNLEDAFDAFEGLAAVKSEGRWGFINDKGKFIIKPQFDKVYAFSEGLAGVQLNGKWGFLSHQTQTVVIQPQFDDVGSLQNGIATVTQNELWGYVDSKGSIIVAPQFEWADNFEKESQVAQVQKNGKIGFVNRKGEIVIAPQFENVSKFTNGFAFVRRFNKVGILSQTGQLVASPKYDEIKPFRQGLAAVRIDEKWGYINATGLLVIPALFDSADSFFNDKAKVSRYGEFFYINAEGKMAMR